MMLVFTELTAQVWTRKSDFPLGARRNSIGFAIDGLGYVCLGGKSLLPGSEHFSDLLAYDAINDIWSVKSSFPSEPRRDAISFVIDSFAYVGLGWNNVIDFTDFLRYNANTDVWDTLNSYPGIGNGNCFSASVKGKGYVGGGKLGTSGPAFADFWEYNPSTDLWTVLGTLPFGNRGSGVSVQIDTLIYFGMGSDGLTAYSDLWAYDPIVDQWTQLSDMPGEGRVEPVFFVANDKLVVGGGTAQDFNIVYSDYFEYDPDLDSWRALPGFCSGERSASAHFSINNKGYLVNGLDDTENIKDIWEFDPTISQILELGEDTTLCTNESIVINAFIENSTYSWSDGSSSSELNVNTPGNFSVEVFTEACDTLVDTILVSLEDCECILEVPNVFTPNDDQINDVFGPVASHCNFTIYDLIIFNRWGNRVFRSTNHELGWDGRIKSKKAKPGIYSYSLNYKTGPSTENVKVEGSFLLTR